MEEDAIPLRSDILEDFYEASRNFKNPGTQRQAARHTSSHVDFRFNGDIERIRNGETSRKKHRTKCRHCDFTHCQDCQENNSIDANRKSDRFSRKNSEKPEATLNQHFEYEKNGACPMNSHRPSGSRQQRSQAHRPGTSTVHFFNRSNQLPTRLHGHSQKSEKFCHRERSGRDSRIHEYVNSDLEINEADYCLSRGQTQSRNLCKSSEPFWRSGVISNESEIFMIIRNASGGQEAHSEPETDVSPRNRGREGLDLKKRKSGQCECIEVTGSEIEGKALVETGSSVGKEVWQQCERDERELKGLREDLRQFVKHKMSSGQVVEEKKQRDEMSSDTLEKISRFVSKVPALQQKNSREKMSPEPRKYRASSPKTRLRTSRIDTRKSYQFGKIEERLGGEPEDRELRRKLEDELLDIQLEKLHDDEQAETYEEDDEEEPRSKEDEAASETEEEARQLLKEEMDLDERDKRRFNKSWTGMLAEGGGNLRDMRNNERPGEDENSREKSKREGNKYDTSKTFYKPPEVAVTVEKRNYSDPTVTRGDHLKNDSQPLENIHSRKNKTTCRDESSDRNATREKLHERPNPLLNLPKKYCNGSPTELARKHDIDLTTKKTKAFIDEMIDDGLCREAKRVNPAVLSLTKKELLEEETDRVYLKDSRNSDVPTNTIRGEDSSRTMTRRRGIFPISPRKNRDLSRTKRDDCFCRRIGKIIADNPSPEYVRKLKNRRWYYLDNIRNVLAKLYDLEGFLDMCSPGREAYVFKTEINPDFTT